MNAGPHAVLWDMDGTLVDTEPYWMAAEHELAERYGRTWTDADGRSIIGFDLLDAASVIVARTGIPLSPEDVVDRLVEAVAARLGDSIPWRPGARELLSGLGRAGVPCALVTMSWRNLVQPILAALPQGAFRAVVTGDMVSQGKPHPEPYRRAAEMLGLSPYDCVAIEDSPTGIASAEGAGCKVVAVPNMLELDPAPNRIVVGSLTELTPSDFLPVGEPVTAGARVAAGTGPGGGGGAPAPYDGGLDVSSDLARDGTDWDDDWDDGAGVRGGWRPGGLDGAISRRILAAVAAVIVLILGLVGWQLLRDEEPPPPLALNVHTWAPYWTLDDSLEGLDDRASQFGQLSPFWYSAVGVDQITVNEQADADEVEEFLDVAKSNGATIIPSIVDGNGAGVMAGILADAEQRAAHIDALVEFAATGDFPGIDLDYEQFAFADDASTWPSVRPNWVRFVSELAARLHGDGRTLTVTVPPIYDDGRTGDSGYWVYDHGAIAESADFVRIMAYDYSTSEPGPIGPLAWTREIVSAVKDVVDDDSKIILGIPMYGYNWPIATDGTCPESEQPERTSISTRGIPDLARRRNATPVYDETTGESSFTYEMDVTDGTTTCKVTRQVHFVDAAGVEARIRLAVGERLGGVALWAFGFDDADIWARVTAIDDELTPDTTSG